MAIAQSTPIPPLYFQREEPLQINLDSLVLAMITTFNTKIAQEILFKHIVNLFNDLNLIIPDDLFSEISDSLKSLSEDNFLQNQKGGYLVTNEGKKHGLKSLKNFQEIIRTFF